MVGEVSKILLYYWWPLRGSTDLLVPEQAVVRRGGEGEGQPRPEVVERRGEAVEQHTAAAAHAPPREPHAPRVRLRYRRQREPARYNTLRVLQY